MVSDQLKIQIFTCKNIVNVISLEDYWSETFSYLTHDKLNLLNKLFYQIKHYNKLFIIIVNYNATKWQSDITHRSKLPTKYIFKFPSNAIT